MEWARIVTYEIPDSDLVQVLAALRAGDPERKRVATQIEGQALLERLKKYDPPEGFEEHIGSLVCYLKAQFRLEDWTGHVSFETILPDQEDGPDSEVRATIHVNDTYLYYRLRIAAPMLEAWKNQEWSSIGHSLCHEFAHVLTHPLARMARYDAAPSQKWLIDEMVERQTQRIAVIIAESLPDDWYTPDALSAWRARHPEEIVTRRKPEPAA